MSTFRIPPTVTAWTLADPVGRAAKCLMSNLGTRSQLVIWDDDAIVLWETFATGEEARRRADELCSLLVKNEWRPVDDSHGVHHAALRREYFRRACPECRQETAVVTYRRHGYVVLFCETCEHGWTDRERAAAASQHPVILPHRDRRRVA